MPVRLTDTPVGYCAFGRTTNGGRFSSYGQTPIRGAARRNIFAKADEEKTVPFVDRLRRIRACDAGGGGQPVPEWQFRGAEALLATLPDDPSALHMLGVMRTRQGRMADAAALFARAIDTRPDDAQTHLNYAKVLTALARHDEAIVHAQKALELDNALSAAHLLLAKNKIAGGLVDQAIQSAQAYFTRKPDDITAASSLAGWLVKHDHALEAAALLEQVSNGLDDAETKATLHTQIAALLRPVALAEAAGHLAKARLLAPDRPDLPQHHAAVLEEGGHLEEAARIYAEILEEAPQRLAVQEAYNRILYRLGDERRFLVSYDRAPQTDDMVLSKAALLVTAGRYAEARALYHTLSQKAPQSVQVATGLGLALAGIGDHHGAAAVLEQAACTLPASSGLWSNLSGILAQAGEPEKAAEAAQRALALDPHDQSAIAMLGTSWRMRGACDREEDLIGYNQFITAIDLATPSGYATMADFHAELETWLAHAHPAGREPLGQSLRGGTQTIGNLLDRQSPILAPLRSNLAEAIRAYVDGLAGKDHPFAARRRDAFTITGSWSSQLRSGGHHINHLHPGGWISACYYVAVPQGDDRQQEGWIKFGEPSFDAGFGARKALRPQPGRLILFPSYMWHGTIACHSQNPRTTIAFDILPA